MVVGHSICLKPPTSYMLKYLFNYRKQMGFRVPLFTSSQPTPSRPTICGSEPQSKKQTVWCVYKKNCCVPRYSTGSWHLQSIDFGDVGADIPNVGGDIPPSPSTLGLGCPVVSCRCTSPRCDPGETSCGGHRHFPFRWSNLRHPISNQFQTSQFSNFFVHPAIDLHLGLFWSEQLAQGSSPFSPSRFATGFRPHCRGCLVETAGSQPGCPIVVHGKPHQQFTCESLDDPPGTNKAFHDPGDMQNEAVSSAGRAFSGSLPSATPPWPLKILFFMRKSCSNGYTLWQPNMAMENPPCIVVFPSYFYLHLVREFPS